MTIDLAARAAADLEELLAGTATTQPPAARRRKLGGRWAPGNEAWVSLPGGIDEVRITRSRAFTTWESRIFEPYGSALADLDGVPEVIARAAENDILPRAISIQLGGTEGGDVVEGAIRFLLSAATSTYEGQPISISVALDLDLNSGGATISSLAEYAKNEWHSVLGSGAATALLLDQAGGVVQLVDMHELMSGSAVASDALYPDAFRYLGRWAEESEDRIAMSLTRSRELLIQSGGFLRYIFRSGRWKSLPVDNATSIGWCHNARIAPTVKKAVLASAIDASLAHHGACLAVVAPGYVNAFNKAEAVAAKDLWPADPRAALFGRKNFLELSRRQRVELLSMDGATILNRSGDILAAGAIVRVTAGSTGGGRLAATRELARYGAALKVSQDGPIRLFGADSAGEPVEIMSLA